MSDGEVLQIFGATVRAMRAHLDRVLKAHALRLGQCQVLRVLWEADALTPRELAQRLEVEMPTVTRTVQRMVRDGLVSREPHSHDARSVVIRLTERGRAVKTKIGGVLANETEHALAGFSDEDRAVFVTALKRMHENVRR